MSDLLPSECQFAMAWPSLDEPKLVLYGLVRGDHWLDFVVLQVVSYEGPDLLYHCDRRGYGPSEWGIPADEAETFLTGYVKWDGCSEIELDEHFCGRRSADAVPQAFDLVYSAAALMPAFDPDLAE